MATGRIGTTPVLRTRWSKEPAGGTTSLSGLDDYSVSLVYEVGYEAVYQNGALLSRGNDYTATNGTTITLTNATVAGDIIEVFANNVVPLTDTYSQSVADGKFVNNTIVDAKGDLIVGSAADTFTRLAVGSANQVLTVDSATTSGLKWATPASGGLTLLDTVALSGSSTTSATFSSAYKYLVFYFKDIYGSAGETSLKIRFNGDTGNNYAWAFIVIGGSEVQTGTSNIRIGSVNTQSATLQRTNATVELWRPSDTDVVFVEANAVYRSTSIPQWSNTSAIYDNSAAITSLTVFVDSGTFTAGTVFIYGGN